MSRSKPSGFTWQLALVQAWRMTLRDWRAGELRLLSAALIIAVASVTSVGFLSDRIRNALERDAGQLLGADLVVQSDAPTPKEWRDEAGKRGLQVAEVLQFPSMATTGQGDDQRAQLSAMKAVEPGYPLRGNLRVATGSGAPDEIAKDVPASGKVWVDAQLLGLLEVGMGDSIRLGDRSFTIDKLIVIEPDRGMNFINVAPRVMIRADDLASTGLVTAGSRIGYRLLLAGPAEAVSDFSNWLTPRLTRGQRIESLESGRPEMRQTIDRADRFLSLVALLAALIAAVAVALSARRFTLRHLDSVAIMRCLGSTQGSLSWLFAIEFFYLALGAAAVGSVLGFVGHEALLLALGNLITTELPRATATPAIQGFLSGVWLLLGFALPPLAQLRRVPPIRVLRRDVGTPQARTAIGYAIGALGFALLLMWFARDIRLGLLTVGGFLVGFAVFAGVAFGGVKLLEPLRRWSRGPVVLRFALAGVIRRRSATITQVCALSIGLMAILLLSITRTDLVDGWRNMVSVDAPNRFVINIQPDQLPEVRKRLQAAGVSDGGLAPMVRGRLTQINGKPVQVDAYSDERAKRLVDREFNLSYMTDLPEYNQVVAGKWFAPDSREVSFESGIAETLGLKLGDKLQFDVGGNVVDVTVTSLRKLDWDSMRVNFFAITSPAALADMPQSWITAFHLPDNRIALTNELVRDFPNLTIFDTGAILRQVESVLNQVTAAVQFLFIFTLAAGVLVLYAALASTRDERVHEAGLLRALGATRRQLSMAQWLELSAIGALAGILASFGATATAWLLARFAFNFTLSLNLWVWVAGLALGMICALVGGWMGLRGVLRQSPLATLREA
ncbi:FtsX-like permease family protein [Pigmentiphaga aceris]|uniref:FtsX-like permease family protein n=2 Tax=Pigmentiphaga aceris TaxID=1940612 RepID=A0A5C0B1P3_9BURK|nr:FtsX-like permease family protein [Pigmentiphaga aceris]